MYDKLREQHNEELEVTNFVISEPSLTLIFYSNNISFVQEMETYIIKIRELSEKRRLDIENENTQLRAQFESITLILSRAVLQGNSFSEKVFRVFV